ncbi:MAG: diguanylate cyclase [Deltaproteobacteria bacterium]|nr:diguanylate cyclase [Deltaproteobacteria bacterium]
MNLFSILSLLAFAFYVHLGFYAYRLEPKSKLNRLLLILCLDLSWWAFTYSFVYSAPDKEVLWIWFKLSAPAWCTIGGMTLHFLLRLSRKETILKKWWIFPLLYLPGIIFTFRAWTGVLTAKDFVPTSLGWIEVGAPESIWLWLHTLNYSTCILVGCFLTFQWGRKSRIKREKKQARLIVGTIVLSLLLGTVINIFLPALRVKILPAVAPILILIWGYGIWRAIVKYRFMALSTAIAGEDILSRIKDILIVSDSEGKINKVNRQAAKVLGYRKEDLVGQSLGMIFRDEGLLREIIREKTNKLFSSPNREVEYQAKSGELIPVNISWSIIKDALEDVMGLVIVGEDLRPTLQLKNEIIVRNRAENALLKAHDELEARIKKRTEELFRANEALQEEVAERQEAERLFKALFIQSPIGSYIVQGGKPKIVNPEFERVTGYNEKELSSIPCLDLVHPEDREKTRQHAIQMLKGERHHPYEFRTLTKDARTRWILETVTSIRYQGLPATLGSFMDITYRKESEDIIRHLAYFDSLTGLPNRTLFLDRLSIALAQTERSGQKLTIMMLDLDNFKSINDNFGHNWGDLLLKEVGRRLNELLRKSDTVARLGGDEFIILLPETGDEKDSEKIAEKILEVIRKPFHLDNRPVQITISIGLSFYPKDGKNAEHLIKNADQAMYRAKSEGRNRIVVF